MDIFKKMLALAALIIALTIAFRYAVFLPWQDHKRESAKKYCHQWAIDESKHYGYKKDDVYPKKFESCLNEQGF